MNTRPNAAIKDLRALGADLAQADDTKVLRIAGMLDELGGNGVVQTLMDPLRPRLAQLRPTRPMRFARILFTPFDTLIVPARSWRPGDPTLSRGMMATIAATVQAGLPELSRSIEADIRGQRSDAIQLIVQVGARLWPAAAQVLAETPTPVNWEETGLPITTWPAIARSVAVVLERAPLLMDLIRDVRVGALDPDENAIRALLSGLPESPPEGGAMVVRVVLEQLPRAAPILRRMITMSQDSAEKRILQRALDRGMDDMLDNMESETGIAKGLGQGSIASAGEEVRRIAKLLEDLDNDPSAPRQRGRLQSIRERLDTVCQARFAAGVDKSIVSPLAEPEGPVAGPAQTALEKRARELKVFETAARTIGGSSKYDAMLGQAARAVETAGDTGTLTTGRVVRLVEILLGSEAAEDVYLRSRIKARAGQVGTGQAGGDQAGAG